jgi:DNA replication protein DnaD
VRSYGYLRKILNRYVEQGFKTIGDVKADKAAFERNKQAKASPSKHNYQQHEYTDNDFGADFFYDPSKDYGGRG